jgi:hypothetical protein
MKNNNKIKFPILSFKKKDKFLYYFEKEKEFLTTTELILKQKVFEGLTIVDSDGFVYKFKHAKKIGYVGFFGINPLLKGWWKDREIKIEMEFEPNVEKIELSALKQIALEKVEKSKQFWKEAWSIKELKNAINEAKTFEELITLFK